VCWPLRGSRGTQYTQKNLKIYREKKKKSSLPASIPFSRAAPSWGTVVRDGVIARLPPSVNKSDFLALHERCMDSGLQARVSIRHQAGSQEITVSCRIIALSTDATAPVGGHRHRCRRRRAQTDATADTNAPRPNFTLDHPPSSREAPFPVAPSPPSVAATSMPAKRTRKATKL
jgi:hypothetical protein